jgi:hypothetical protein
LLCDSLAWAYKAIFVPTVVLILPSGFGHEDEAPDGMVPIRVGYVAPTGWEGVLRGDRYADEANEC